MTAPTFFTVIADYKSVVVDLASDVDADPQLGPITAKVTFTPVLANGDVILATNASPRPTGYVAAPIVARIDTDGRLKLRVDPDGDQDSYASTAAFPATGNTAKVYWSIAQQKWYRWTGSAYAETYPYAPVRLLADTPLLELDSDLYYRVAFSEVVFNGAPGYISPFVFQAPTSDTELNLIEVTPVPGELASGITKIVPGAVRAEGGDIVFSFAGVDIPDPVPFADVISESDPFAELVTAALTAATPAIVEADLAARDINVVDAGGGEIQFTLDGDPLGDPVEIPSAAWSSVTGKPAVIAAGADAAAARTAIGATATGAALFTATTAAAARTAIGAPNIQRARFGGRTVVDGDSITADSTTLLVNNQSRRGWTQELLRLSQGRINIVNNAAVGGTGIAARISNFATKVAAYSPQTVIMSNGTNDLGTPIATYLASLDTYYDLCADIGAQLVLGGVYPKSASQSTIAAFNDAYVKWGAERGVPVIPFWELGNPADGTWPSGWSGDGTHPTSASGAFAAMGQLAWRTLEPLMGEPVAPTAKYVGEGIYTNFFTDLTGSTGTATIASITDVAGTLPAGTYEYRVGAGNYFGLTTSTDEDSITLAAPGGVALSVSSTGTYQRRRVFRKDPGSDTFKYIGEITASGTQTFTDSGITATYDWVAGDTSLIPVGLVNGGGVSSHTLAYGGPIQTDPAIRGNFLRIAKNVAEAGLVQNIDITGLTAGTQITVSFKCRGAGAVNANNRILLRLRTSASANVEVPFLVYHQMSNEWGLIHNTYIVPATVDRVRFAIESEGTVPYTDIAELRIALAAT